MADDLALDFTASGTGAQNCGAGWSDAEPDGTWMLGQKSVVLLPRPDAEGDYLLELELGALVGPGRERQRLVVSVDGTAIAEMVLPPVGVRHCMLPWSAIGTAPKVTLVLSHPDAWRLSDLEEGNGDQRELSLQLRTLRLTLLLPAAEAPVETHQPPASQAGVDAAGGEAVRRPGVTPEGRQERGPGGVALGQPARPIAPLVPPRRGSWWTRLIGG